MTATPSRFLAAAVVAAALAGAGAGAAQAGGAPSGKLIAANCFNCHGPEGMSAGVVDGLDGLSARAVGKKLREFKEGLKPATIMQRIAKGYTDDEIEAVSQYFGSLSERAE